MRLVRVTFGIALQLLCYGSAPSDAEDYISAEIKLRFYSEKQRYDNKNYLERPLDQATQLFSESKGYNRSLPLVLLVHGMAMGADSHFVNGIVQALMKKKVFETHNIFAVDMPKVMENDLDSKLYFGVLSHVKPTGQRLGGFLNYLIRLKIITPEKINIIGYSMGTQVAGYIAREIKGRFGKIHYIAGLEPVGPGFHSQLGGKLPSLTHVSVDDAKVTHLFHTNSHGFGSHSRDGTADFVFNNGNIQPGCDHSASLNCSHSRVPYLYEEALLTPKQFEARSCETWHHFSNCQCEARKTVLIDFPPDPTARGIYFLRTNEASPYGLGKKGSQCEKRKENIIVHNLAEDSASAEHKHAIIKGLDIYGKRALNSLSYFYKVLKGEKKNVDADYGEEDVASETDTDTGDAEVSGVNSFESKNHPKTTSVKYEIEFRPHENGPQANRQKNVFSLEKSPHTSVPKPKNIKVSHLDINHDRASNKIKEGTLTKMTVVKPSNKDTAGKKSNGNTPKSKTLEKVGFEETLQSDEELENGNYASDDVIVFEDTLNLYREDDGSKDSTNPPVEKLESEKTKLSTGHEEENKENVKNDKEPKDMHS